MKQERQKYILAVDLGTSGPKSALVSTRGEIIDHAFVPNDVRLLPGGGAEQDPGQWWNSIMETFRMLLSRRQVPPEDIVGVNCSSQWSGTVAVDRGGAPLMNAVIWLDSRGSPYIKEITGGPVRIEGYGVIKLQRWVRLTGGAPSHSGKDSIAHILYIKNRHPEIYQRTYKFLEPKDYINFRLTGRIAASVDSITLHWVTDNRDIHHIRYDDKLVAMSGIDRDKLPELKGANAILGTLDQEVAANLGLSPDVKVVMGTPDVQAAAVGSGGVNDFEAHFYIGTSAWLTCHVPFKKTDIVSGIASLPSAIPGKYFVADEQETAGACLNFLRDNLFFCDDALGTQPCPPDAYKRFDQAAAAAPPGSGNVIFTPWLYGERTPLDDRFVRGGFFNQSLDTTRAHMIRAVLEGVAFNGRWLLSAVEKFTRRRLDPIRMIGGGASSDIWRAIFADVFDRTIIRIKQPLLANVRGAALLAAVALGYMDYRNIPDAVEAAGTDTPDPANRDIYDRLFEQFKRIYRKNRKIYRKLNRLKQ